MPIRRPSPHRGTALALLALWSVAAASACIRDPDPFTVDSDDLAVHLLLQADSDSALAIVEYPDDPAEDADVRLIRGPDTTTLVFSGPACAEDFGAPSTPGCFRALLPRPVQAGATYDLEIRPADGGLITGRTTVPLPLTVADPTPGERLQVSCGATDTCFAGFLDRPPYYVPVLELAVHWMEPTPADRLFGHVRHIRSFLDDQAYDEEDACGLGYFGFGFAGIPDGSAAQDSLVVPVPNIQCAGALSPALFDSIHAEVRLQHLSPDYADYLETIAELGDATRQGGFGLVGAWGVFGSITTTSVPVTLVRDPPPAP